MVNIYNLYITRNKLELEYFHRLVHFLSFVNLNDTVVQLVHLNFKSNDIVPNIKLNNTKMRADVYNFGSDVKMVSVIIYNLDDLIKLYKPLSGVNVFIYTGHSDGVYLIKQKVRLLRIEDFCELVYRVSKKADLMIFDCCLCANISCLYICYPFTKYLMAATSYQSYLSVLETHNLYKFKGDIASYTKIVIKEFGNLEKIDNKAYDSDFSLYQMNEYLLEFIQLVLKYKDQFDENKSFVIDSAKYKDLECCFSDLGIDVKPLINKFVIVNRYHKLKCANLKLSKKKDYSIPSSLMIILKRPVKYSLQTRGDIFLK